MLNCILINCNNTVCECLQINRMSAKRREGLLVSELKRVSTSKPHKLNHILYVTCERCQVVDTRLELLDTILDTKRESILVHCGVDVGMTGAILGVYYN